MRSTCALLGLLAGLGLVACSSAGQRAASSTTASRPRATSGDSSRSSFGARDADDDIDNASSSRYDGDDREWLESGHPASPAEMREIATLVQRYYAAAAALNGSVACPLLSVITVESIAEQAGQTVGSAGVPTAVCAALVAKELAPERSHYAQVAASLRLSSVRVEGHRGKAFIIVGNEPPPRDLTLRREGGRWRVAALDDGPLP